MKKIIKIFLVFLLIFNFILTNSIKVKANYTVNDFNIYSSMQVKGNWNSLSFDKNWESTSTIEYMSATVYLPSNVAKQTQFDFKIEIDYQNVNFTNYNSSKNIYVTFSGFDVIGEIQSNYDNETGKIYVYGNDVSCNYIQNKINVSLKVANSLTSGTFEVKNVEFTLSSEGDLFAKNSYDNPQIEIEDNDLIILNPSNECNYEIYYFNHLLKTLTPNNIVDNQIRYNLSNHIATQGTFTISVRAINNESTGSGKEPSEMVSIDYNRTTEKLPKPSIEIIDDYIYISNVVEYATYVILDSNNLLVDSNNKVVILNIYDNSENGKIVYYLPNIIKDEKDHSITVNAIPNAPDYYSTNESDPIYYGYNFDIDKPSIAIQGNTLMITSQINANFYDIYVNGVKKTTVAKSTYDLTLFKLKELNLTNGTYQISVIGYNTNESSIESNLMEYVVDDYIEDDSEEEVIDKEKFTPWKIKLTSWADDIFESDWITNQENAYGISLIDCPNTITKLELWFDIDKVNVGNTIQLEFSFSQSGLKWSDSIYEIFAIDTNGNYHEIELEDCVFMQDGWNLLGDGIIKFVNTTEHEIESIYINWYSMTCKSLTFSMTTMNTSKSFITKSKEEIENDRQNAILGFVSEIPNLPNKIGTVIGDKFEEVGNTITNAVTNIGDKISETVEKMKDGVTNAVEQTGNMITNAIAKIQQWLSDLLGGILDGLKSLFIPSDEFFNQYFDDLYSFFNDKLGILIMPLDILISFMDNISNLGNGDGILYIPQFKFMNQTLIPETQYNMKSDIQEVFGGYYDLYLLITDVIIYFMLFNMAKKKFESIVGGSNS